MGWFRSVFPDDEWQLDDVIEQGHKLVVRYTGYMTYKGVHQHPINRPKSKRN
ncbi:hypothetical protein [Radiobacillus deserti]|uniref:hypothetical protein n=1 Tax=Radiobacillus deserti TaxID=2594883 RepID=UPI001315499D|nr:hypothetical protein [Radiobacillus deserti]